MNKRRYLFITMMSIFFGFSSIQSHANQLKTSSLTMVKNTANPEKKLSPLCIKMFNEGSKLISEAEKQPGTHTQVSQMKSKLSSSKAQILKMDTVMQDKSCDKGLIALNQLKQKY